MEPLAHSARPKKGIPAQKYSCHVNAVMKQATENARKMAEYYNGDREELVRAISLTAELHDLGKLDAQNQLVLASGEAHKPLPIKHWDAGVAEVLHLSRNNLLAASLIYAHHVGLPDFQKNSGENFLRDDMKTREATNQRLGQYVNQHQKFFPAPLQASPSLNRISPVTLRLALSCLVDADHQDTAMHYGQYLPVEMRALQPESRLNKLDNYVERLGFNQKDERNLLRSSVYHSCRQAKTESSIYACDSPVGSGKTTAVMAYMLNVAAVKNLRRIFVVLPFTNIIDQSVAVYREALTINRENAQEIVAAHHHRAEFADLESRQLTFLWQSPVIVTTAVQFFETLASNTPESLRKLHELPGSAIFIDESHAALPAYLWVQAWRWIKELSDNWGCFFVLGSGSLAKFWTIPEFSAKLEPIPNLVNSDVSLITAAYEQKRVKYRTQNQAMSVKELLEWLPNLPGPRLLILNTVQSAAVVANELAQTYGRQAVEHISTALCPHDRSILLVRVKERLKNPSDNNWTLVGTSCIEAGVNLSFASGIRERCGLSSLIQVGGRVNRNGEYPSADVWDIHLKYEGNLVPNPDFDASARILGYLFDHRQIGPEWVTKALEMEIRERNLDTKTISEAENKYEFPVVAHKFKVINDDTVTAVIDRGLIARIEAGEKVDTNILQELSVQIPRYKKSEWLSEISAAPGLYAWELQYDNFLGYMAGVIRLKTLFDEGGVI